MAQLKKDIDSGIEQIERGEYIEITVSELGQFVETIKEEGRQRRANNLQSNLQDRKSGDSSDA